MTELNTTPKIIPGVVIFTTGVHNGLEVTIGILEDIVTSFTALGLSGRVMLKLGHSEDQELKEGQPALGVVRNVRRQNSKLVADFVDVPPVLYAAIKQALYRSVSVELLRNVTKDGTTYPWVLDSVAILGADIPAVNGVSDLTKLVATRQQPAFTFESRETYSCQPDQRPSRSSKARATAPAQSDDAEALRKENEKLRADLAAARGAAEKFTAARTRDAALMYQRAVLAEIEAAVRSKKILPRAREQLIKLKRLNDPAECMKFARADLALFFEARDADGALDLLSTSVARQPPAGESIERPSPVDRLMVRARAIFARGGVQDMFEATNIAMREDATEANEMWEHDREARAGMGL